MNKTTHCQTEQEYLINIYKDIKGTIYHTYATRFLDGYSAPVRLGMYEAEPPDTPKGMEQYKFFRLGMLHGYHIAKLLNKGCQFEELLKQEYDLNKIFFGVEVVKKKRTNSKKWKN